MYENIVTPYILGTGASGCVHHVGWANFYMSYHIHIYENIVAFYIPGAGASGRVRHVGWANFHTSYHMNL